MDEPLSTQRTLAHFGIVSAFFKDMHVGSPYVPILVDVLVATVMGALAGGVIGLVLGMMNKGGTTEGA